MNDFSEKLSKSAQRVQVALAAHQLSMNVVELAASTRTASDAALAINCELAQIVKTLLFKTDNTDQPVLILASGVNRVKEKQIETLINEKIVKADADYTRMVTGFAIGGVAPIGHTQKINHVFIDEDLFKWRVIWAAAGTPHAVFSLSPQDLQCLTDGKIISVTG